MLVLAAGLSPSDVFPACWGLGRAAAAVEIQNTTGGGFPIYNHPAAFTTAQQSSPQALMYLLRFHLVVQLFSLAKTPNDLLDHFRITQ